MGSGMIRDTAIPDGLLQTIQAGTMAYQYKGLPTWKCPLDIAIYMDLLWKLRPATIVEFGSNRGGSALMLADQLAAVGLEHSRVYSYDIHPVTDVSHPKVTFGYVDVADPGQHLDDALFASFAHPILVIDDASHMGSHVLATLRYVDRFLKAGDYIVVEDGILTHLGWSEQYEGGPLVALETFLTETGDRYQIDRDRCDTFGRNVTWNVDGYVKCIAG